MQNQKCRNTSKKGVDTAKCIWYYLRASFAKVIAKIIKYKLLEKH